MNIVDRGKAVRQALRALAAATAWDWRRCPACGDTLTCRWGSSTRHPWPLAGRGAVGPPRHLRGGLGLAGRGELVRTGGPALRDRPLAAPGHQRAPDRGGAAE